jgi:hypothetical protein
VTAPIDAATLALWQKACEEASPEPWEAKERTKGKHGNMEWEYSWTVHGLAGVHICHEADARFIALARTAVPKLLAENAALRGWRELAEMSQRQAKRLERHLLTARTEAAQLRAQVEALGRERDQMQRQVENLGDMLGMIKKAGR